MFPYPVLSTLKVSSRPGHAAVQCAAGSPLQAHASHLWHGTFWGELGKSAAPKWGQPEIAGAGKTPPSSEQSGTMGKHSSTTKYNTISIVLLLPRKNQLPSDAAISLAAFGFM